VNSASPAKQLAGFLARFDPRNATVARAARAKLRRRLPRAIEMVYDNYNALVIGFSATMRPSDAIVSIVIYPRAVNLCFLHGRHLADPAGLLRGAGNQVRSLRLDQGAAILDTPPVRALLAAAIAFADTPFAGPHRLVIRSISATRRPRRPLAARRPIG
jgi:hypothetical protein